MTLVDLASLFTVEGGFSPSARAVATAQYWVGNRPSVDVAGSEVRFSVPIRVPLEGDPVTIDMVPTAGVRCVKWSVEDVENRRSLTRFTEIPDLPTVAFGDLVDVDPTTFEPSAEGKAAWDAAVEAAQSAVAGAVAAKDAARVSAEAAGDAADAAIPAASEAVSAASTATTAASDAGSARDEAVSAAGDAVAASVALSGAVGDVAGLKTLTTTGRLGEAELAASFVGANPDVTIERNPDGSVASVSENGVTETYTRDALGRVDTITRDGVTKTILRDLAGNVTGVN